MLALKHVVRGGVRGCARAFAASSSADLFKPTDSFARRACIVALKPVNI